MDKKDLPSKSENTSTLPLHYPSDELTEEERRDLLVQIDKSIVEKPVSAPTADLLQAAAKKGYVQPLFINIAALIAVLVAFAVAFSVFQSRQVRLALDTNRYYSTEGKILEAFKRQSEQQLREKDNLIFRILKQLEVLENQRVEMNRLIVLNITKKREALDAEILTSLELEKERLAAAGYEPSEITSRLTKMEQEKEQERDEMLEEYRNESRDLLKAQEAALLSRIRENEKTLQSAADEREQLMKEIARREQELTAESEDASREAAPDASDAYTELKRIMDAREREALFMDQINASFSHAVTRIALYDAPAASEALEQELVGLDDGSGWIRQLRLANQGLMGRQASASVPEAMLERDASAADSMAPLIDALAVFDAVSGSPEYSVVADLPSRLRIERGLIQDDLYLVLSGAFPVAHHARSLDLALVTGERRVSSLVENLPFASATRLGAERGCLSRPSALPLHLALEAVFVPR